MPAWRTVRVFISSTFRDMHSERDWLVKRVFPALRERLESYRVHLVDIDLRWGVTQQQAEHGGALDVCLEQIDACRPFFLGILGERYGWTPDDVPDSAVERLGDPRSATNKSITELEILYGVLARPEMRGHALFCFRDPSFVADVPEAKRADFLSEDPDSAEKQRRLKQTIRDSGLPFVESYPCRYAGLRLNRRIVREETDTDDNRETLARLTVDGLIAPAEREALEPRLRTFVDERSDVALSHLEEFGRRVEEWLWDAVRSQFELPERPPTTGEADRDPLAEEQDYHERFVESRTRIYVGREDLQRRLFAYADGAGETPCLVSGPSGRGKSAVIAKFVESYARKRPKTLVVPHFVGASPTSTSLRSMLYRFCATLKQAFAFADDVPPDTNSLISTFRQFVAQVPADRRVVLVVDGLNQLDESERAQELYWLPWTPPPHVKIVTSCIDDPGRDEPAMKAFANRGHESIRIEPLTDGERAEIVRAVPSLSAKTLDPRQVDLLLENPAAGNPLFLLTALEELRGFGSYERLTERIARLPREGDVVTALFVQMIDRLEEEFEIRTVHSVLTLLASARRGLSDRELLDVVEGANVETYESAGDLFPILRQLRPYLQHRGRLRDFFHRNLYKAVREKYLSDHQARAAAHARLATYFDGQDYFLESLDEQRARAKRLPPTPRPANVRKVDELPWQRLQTAKLSGGDDPTSPHWDAIADLFTDLSFLEAKAEARPEGQA